MSSNCTDGSIRLVGGSAESTGKLEVCVEGVYGAICNQNWTNLGSEVACSQLGFPRIST